MNNKPATENAPAFAMSMYANKTSLLEAKAEYFENLANELQATLDAVEVTLGAPLVEYLGSTK